MRLRLVVGLFGVVHLHADLLAARIDARWLTSDDTILM
jgi:hypothetical protein